MTNLELQQTVTSLFRKRVKQAGLPPGSLVYVGEQKSAQSALTSIDYSGDRHEVKTAISPSDCERFKNDSSVTWINLDGVHDMALVEQLGKVFELHPLTLEDILNTGHPPKFEEFDNCALVIIKMFYLNEESFQIEVEQISLVLTADNVLTFQERPGDVFDEVRQRLGRKSGRIRDRGADYLAYTLIDSVVDSYFHVLEKIGDRLESLETELINQPSQELLQQVHQTKGQLLFLRKSIWPVRELVSRLQHSESPLVNASTNIFLRDLYDHAMNALEIVEGYRESASSLVDLYMSSVSQRMNEVMQVLTMMASIFIPLTFIAGIYGMNFAYMPELQWRYGYFAVWALMLICALLMLWFFKRKKWF